LQVPVDDPALKACNQTYYSLEAPDEDYPSIQVLVSDEHVQRSPNSWDSNEKYYQRLLNDSLEGKSGRYHLTTSYGEAFSDLKCIKHGDDNMLHHEVSCARGMFGTRDLPLIVSCDKPDSVPNPGCQMHDFTKELHIEATFSNKCAPIFGRIRMAVERYVMVAKRGD
jgi:hypothetical protein